MKTCLITGAGGFIGGFLVEEALQQGYTTFAGIRHSTDLTYLSDTRIQLLELDFRDPLRLTQQLLQLKEQNIHFNLIIHNLGATQCPHPEDFHRINCTFLEHFTLALEQSQLIPDKFILISSLGITLPETAYGKSKMAAEQHLSQQKHFPWVIVRPTGVYGPREKDYFLLYQTIQHHLVIALGRETQQLTFLYVKDLAAALFQLAETPLIHRSYTLAENRSYTSQEVTDIIKKTLNIQWVFRIIIPLFVLKRICAISEYIAQKTDKPTPLNRDKYQILAKRDWSCDPTQAMHDFNFVTHYSFEQGLQEAITWYKRKGWL